MPHYDKIYYDDVTYRYVYPHHEKYYKYGPFRFITVVMLLVLVSGLLMGIYCLLSAAVSLAEDNPSTTKLFIHMSIKLCIVVHALIMIVDRLSWWRSIVSIGANLFYLIYMRKFPFIQTFSDMYVFGASACTIIEIVVWIFYFVNNSDDFSPMMIASFVSLLCITPLFLAIMTLTREIELPGRMHRQ